MNGFRSVIREYPIWASIALCIVFNLFTNMVSMVFSPFGSEVTTGVEYAEPRRN